MHRYRESRGKTAGRAVSALVLCLATANWASFAQTAQAAPDVATQPPKVSSLVGTERELAFEVARYRAPDGGTWIRMSGAYESAYRATLEDVIATLWDFNESPKNFSRIESTRLRSDTGTVAVIEQRTGVRFLGFSYSSNLVVRDELKREAPGSAVLVFEAIEVDATTLSSRGSWTLEESSDAAGPLTYARYSLESYVAPKFLAQEMMMRQFGGGDLRKLLRELGEATARRIKAGQRRASSAPSGAVDSRASSLHY